jgi:putative N-acetyltransferase (TIGR04045 family)
MMFDPFPVFLPSQYRVKFATEPWERHDAAALRRRVFCDEQGIFAGDDADAIDRIAIPIVVISSFGIAPHEVVGTVRIHEAEPGIWWGSRLAVAAQYRRIGALGSSLIRLAVSSAHARGCKRFFAHVQSQNADSFDCGQGFQLIADSHSNPLRTAFQSIADSIPMIADSSLIDSFKGSFGIV